MEEGEKKVLNSRMEIEGRGAEGEGKEEEDGGGGGGGEMRHIVNKSPYQHPLDMHQVLK